MQEGLRPVSEDLLRERINLALTHGYLTEPQWGELLRSHVFTGDDKRTLEARGQGVYLLVGRAALDLARPHLCEWLAMWGGPTLFEGCAEDLQDVLKGLGRPTIVSVALEFVNERFRPPVSEPLGLVFSSVALKDSEAATEIRYSSLVPPKDIVAVWHPGDLEYDRHSELPRE